MNMVSIIIPHYNGEDLLYNCIDSIYKNISIKDFELIVVDNASTDYSINRIIQLIHYLKPTRKPCKLEIGRYPTSLASTG